MRFAFRPEESQKFFAGMCAALDDEVGKQCQRLAGGKFQRLAEPLLIKETKNRIQKSIVGLKLRCAEVVMTTKIKSRKKPEAGKTAAKKIRSKAAVTFNEPPELNHRTQPAFNPLVKKTPLEARVLTQSRLCGRILSPYAKQSHGLKI